MILKIKAIKAKPFTGDEGKQIVYYWHTAVKEDGFVLNFGSTVKHEVGTSGDFLLEEVERRDGKTGYREVVVK